MDRLLVVCKALISDKTQKTSSRLFQGLVQKRTLSPFAHYSVRFWTSIQLFPRPLRKVPNPVGDGGRGRWPSQRPAQRRDIWEANMFIPFKPRAKAHLCRLHSVHVRSCCFDPWFGRFNVKKAVVPGGRRSIQCRFIPGKNWETNGRQQHSIQGSPTSQRETNGRQQHPGSAHFTKGEKWETTQAIVIQHRDIWETKWGQIKSTAKSVIGSLPSQGFYFSTFLSVPIEGTLRKTWVSEKVGPLI